MSSLADANSSNPDVAGGASRWRFNNNGQFVDSEAESAEWDLADEIVRLKIGEVAGDAAEDIPIRTPPKSKLASAQLAETSPLDTASIPSVNSSPLAPDHIGASHSRGSSTDTTASSSQDSVASNTMVAQAPVKVDVAIDVKERPHSFSGGLSTADLRRLQQVDNPSGSDAQETPFQQQWSSIQFREGDKQQFAPEQPAYPSLAGHGAAVHRPQQVPHPQLYDYRTGAPQNAPNRDDLQIDYNIQQRNFNPLPQGSNVAGPPAFIPGRPNNAVPGMPYRQPPPRGPFPPQQGLLPSPTALGYPGAHAPHLSLGNSQQLYEMMLPGHENHHPAVSRVQHQHNAFRGAHQHSASDPSALRDAATLALLNSNMQAFANNMFPQAMAPPTGMPMYPNQFYAAQEAYGRPDVATAQAMAARLQAQYTGPYGGVISPAAMGMTDGSLSPGSTNGQGPSANNRKLGLYKTELCRSWEEKGTCRYAGKCQFAHGEDELRNVSRHPKVSQSTSIAAPDCVN
jgi:tristetraprolin